MSQLIDNLNTIESIKTDIKAAIENKGVDMTGVSFPGYASKIGEISGGGGWDQKSLTEGTAEIINLNNSASFVASDALQNNINIKTVNLPYATTVGVNAFTSCKSLTLVSLPMCSFIDNYAFFDCRSLTWVSLPMCKNINVGTFQRCYLLTQISLPMCMTINNYAFYKCSSLSIITIGYSSICILASSSALSNTLIASGTGSIYVPASLVSDYQSAKNWSLYSTQIFPISE